MSDRLAGAVTVVTGGATGLGRGLALEAARRGSHVLIASTSDASESVALVKTFGVRALWAQTDVADYESIRALRDVAIEEFGSVNLIINNAASGASGGLDTADPAQVHRLFAVNIGGVFNGIRAFADDLKAVGSEGGFARILNVGSEHSLGVPPHVAPMSAYTAAKYAVLGLTDTARRDFAGTGVQVSLLAPGWILTEKIRSYMGGSEDFRAAVEPLAQSTEEVARLGIDGTIAGERLIVTNPASVEFAMTAAHGMVGDLRSAAIRLTAAEVAADEVDWAHDGSGDISKCPVASHLPGL